MAAAASLANNVGLDVDATGSAALTVGANGTINGEANNASVATANSIDASATATADVDNNIGVDLEGNLSVGADGSLTGTADLDLTATGVTVGDDASSDQVVATAGNSSASQHRPGFRRSRSGREHRCQWHGCG